MPFFTRPHFEDRQIVQYNDESIQLSGKTKIGPTLLDFTGTTTAQTTVTIMGVTGYLNEGREYGFQVQPPLLKISGSTGYTTTDVTGYVLKAVDAFGNVGWDTVSVSADTNTFVTGGTLNGSNQLILNWNTGGSASAIDLSALSDTTYWTAGTSGTGSIRVTNGGGTNATGNYAVAQGFDTKAIGSFSHSEGKNTSAVGVGSHSEGTDTIASGITSHAEGKLTTASGDYSHAEGFQTIASGLVSHTEGFNTIASGNYSHAGGIGSIVSGGDSFIHSTNSVLTGDRSVLLGGQNLTGTTDNTVYVPNLIVREDYILHSDSTLEVTDIPSTFENFIKGSYTEFNWGGITTNLLTNNNPSGSTTLLLGNFSTYPTIKNHGFLSYYGTGYTRTASPATGTDFYRNKMVLKTAEDSDGTVFSNASTTNWWWENDGFSRMKLTSGGFLGLGLNTNGTEDPSEMLHVNGGDVLVGDTNGIFYTDIQNTAGPEIRLSGNTKIPRIAISIAPYLTKPSTGGQIGVRSWDDVAYPTVGKVGDMFLYAGDEANGLNIINGPGTNTEDYIRFYAGDYANSTSDIHIQGSGSTKSYVGIGTESPTEKLHIAGSIRIVDGTEQNGYVLTCDANGVGSWQASSGGGGGLTIDPYEDVGNVNSITWDVSGTSTNYEATLTGNTTLDLTNVRNGDYGTLIVNQDGVGSHTLSFGTVNGAGGTHRVVNGGGGSPTLTSNPNAIDILSFTYNGSVMYWTVGNDYT